VEELKAGNREFESAALQTKKALEEMHLPELDWFMEHCLSAFGRNLDEME
jgi:5'-deoxynucleotidase